MTLGFIDYAIVVVYLGSIAAIGIYLSRGQRTATRYFIADRQVPRWAVGFTLLATLISSNTLVAHPAIVFQKGMILVPGFLALPLVLLAVAYWIVPFYRRVVGMSAYEYIGRRFGIGGRIYSSLGFLMERTFDVGVTLVTTAIALNLMTGWDIRLLILGVGLFTMVYTTIGGITAVVWTDVVQGVILIGGGLLILARLLFAPEAGPPFAVVGAALEGGRMSLGSAEFSWASLYEKERTLWIFIVVMTVQWSRRFICDQHMVQRYLLAKTDQDARWGTLMGAWLSIPVLLMFSFIGACLFGFYELAGAETPAIGDHILPHFIVHYLPAGFVGLLLAAILAASMSSISSDLNSIATVLTRDYFQRFLPGLSNERSLAVGRLMVFLMGLVAAGVGVLLIPEEGVTPIAERALTIAVIVSAGSLGLFSLGFLSRRATRRGAYAGIAGCVLFSAWGILTEPGNRLVDLGPLNFEMNVILVGVLGHVIVFGVGWLVSVTFGGHVPDDIDELVFRRERVRESRPAR